MDIFSAQSYFPKQDPNRTYKVFIMDFNEGEQLFETPLSITTTQICETLEKFEQFPSSFIPVYICLDDLSEDEVLVVEIPLWVFWISKLF